MELKKKKGQHYLLVPISKASHKYLRDFRHYDNPSNVKRGVQLLGHCLEHHIQALYFMNYAKLSEAEGQIKKNQFQPVVNELEKVINSYQRVLDRGIDRLIKANKRKKKRK